MFKPVLSIFLSVLCLHAACQTRAIADSIRHASHIPELAYAVLSSDSVYELQVLGVKRTGTNLEAEPGDKFRIGSNTKAITGFIAARLVHDGQISWDTPFFALYPELKATSHKAYHHLTLIDLLAFRSPLFAYTYTYDKPTQQQFKGNDAEQRYQFTKWFFAQKPVRDTGRIHFSNLGYVAAALMLEKVSGKDYKTLVTELGAELGITFGFGAPNSTDTLQPWGHAANLAPEAPGDNYKLNWLLAAGNINVDLPGYTRFVQQQLRALRGKPALLGKDETTFLHYGLPRFAVGWFWEDDKAHGRYSYNIGNPGSFLSKVFVFRDLDLAIVLFANAQTPDADAGLDALYAELLGRYGPHDAIRK